MFLLSSVVFKDELTFWAWTLSTDSRMFSLTMPVHVIFSRECLGAILVGTAVGCVLLQPQMGSVIVAGYMVSSRKCFKTGFMWTIKAAIFQSFYLQSWVFNLLGVDICIMFSFVCSCLKPGRAEICTNTKGKKQEVHVYRGHISLIKSGSGKGCNFWTVEPRNLMYGSICRAGNQECCKLSRFCKFWNCYHWDLKNRIRYAMATITKWSSTISATTSRSLCDSMIKALAFNTAK